MKNMLLTSALVALTLWSCNKKDENQALTKTENTNTDKSETSSEVISDTGYNISKIPVTDKFHGTFPYFQLPQGYTFTDPNSYHGDGQTKDFDKEYFYDHGS